MSNLRDQTYVDGKFETMKFEGDRKSYYLGIKKIKEAGYRTPLLIK